MCQVSVYVSKDSSSELIKENITHLELINGGVRVKTLFEGECVIDDVKLRQIDFSAGKIILEKPK